MKNTACLPFLTFFHLESIQTGSWSVRHGSFQGGRLCSAKSFGNNTLFCNVGSICVFLQKVIELHEGTEEFQVNWDPRNVGIFLTFARNLAMFELTSAKKT